MEQYKNLPPVQVPDENSRPLGHGAARYDDLDFEMLVDTRRKHQTKQAASGTRTKKTKASGDTLRGQVIRKFNEALKAAQDEQAIGTGLERDKRWRGEAPAAGNAANAAAAAAAAATVAKQVGVPSQCVRLLRSFLSYLCQAATRRKNLFTKAMVPRLNELVDARVTIIRPLQVDDYGFVATANGVMVGQGKLVIRHPIYMIID